MPHFLLLPALAPRPILTADSAVPVLCYHNITIATVRASSPLFISKDQMKQQMQTLHDSGFHIIAPQELHAAGDAGQHFKGRSGAVRCPQ